MASSNIKTAIRVLHVDDDPSLQEITKLMLLDLDSSFEIDNACCVDEAFGKLAVGHYDVVVSDYEMPQKDGLQFLTELRKQNTKTPFVLFTGKGREDIAIKALNLGADAYCNKQGDPETVYGELSHGIKRSVEHYKAKKQLREQNSLLVKIASQTPGMLFQFMRRPNGTYCVPYTSEAIRSIFGCSPQEVREDFSPISRVIVPEDIENVVQSIEYSANHLTPWQCEYRVQSPGQQIRWIWGQSIPEKLVDGSIVWNGYNADVTERKRAAETLADSEAKYRALVENADDAILLTDLRGKNIYRNRAHFKSLGFEEGDEAKIEELMKVHPDDVTLLKQKMRELFQTGYLTSEYRIKNFKGSWSYRHAKSTIIYNIHHQPYAIITIIRDITENKKTEDTLSGKEKRFRAIFDKSFQFALILDINGKVLEMNELCYTFHGPLAEASLGKPFWKAAWWSQFPDVAEKTKLAIQNCQVGKIVHDEVEFIDKDFQIHYGIRIFSPIADENGKLLYISVVGLDISERKKAEEEERKVSHSLGERIKELNCIYGMSKIFEKSEVLLDNALQETVKLFPPAMQLPDITCARIVVGNQEFSTKNFKDTQWKLQADIKVHGKKIGFAEIIYLEEAPIVGGDPFSKEERSLIDLVTEQLGKIIERIQAEEQLKESQVHFQVLNEKLGVVGRLTRHDVGNKLMVMKSNIYLLKKQIGDNPKLAKHLEGINFAINQSDEMFEFSRLYEKIGVEEPSEIDVAQCFNQAATLLPNLDTIKIINDCQGLWVMADSLLKQLFYNFLDNSLKYGEKVTQIQLNFSKEGDNVKLFYEDDGVGIPKANKPKLFHEGFTTGKSTGLGLFLTKKMIEVYGWTITEEGEPGTGAKFTITIPIIDKNGNENYR